MFNITLGGCSAAACNFDKSLTPEALWYQIFLILFTLGYLLVTYRMMGSETFKRFGIMAIAVALYQVFTGPMWINEHLGTYSYLYHNTSWVLILGLTSMSLSIITVIDYLLPKSKEWMRYVVSLLSFIPVMFVIQKFLYNVDIRGYAPEVLEVITANRLPIFDVSWQALFYWLAFFALVMAFYKYFVIALIEHRPLIPIKNTNLLRNIALALGGVVFFEIVVDPMVVNERLPEWSYFYRDVSIIMSGLWVLLIWLGITIVERFWMNADVIHRFFLFLLIVSVFGTPLEAWLINNGFRVYGESAQNGFSGIDFPLLNVPIEVVFAIPFYIALVAGFVRYWQIVIDNRL